MLPDQDQYYGLDNRNNNESTTYGYRRKLTKDIEIVAIAECYECGMLMSDKDDVIPFNDRTFCSEICIQCYIIEMEEE